MDKITRRHVVMCTLVAPFAAHAQTQTWPPGLMRVIVPFPAGGSVDAVARLVQARLQQRLGATVVIENQAGGSGSVGAARVAKSPPDGSTWLFVFDSHAVNPFLQSLPYDSTNDLDPVMLIGTAPNVLATHPLRPYKSLGDVIAAAKAKPDSITYATIGAGSLGHLTMVRLGKQAGVQLTHVPYRGGGPAMNDALAGHVDLIIGSAALVNPQLEGNALRALVQFGPTRAAAPTLKDVPTAAESGIAGVESSAWWGVFAPPKTPAPILERFVAELRATLRDDRVAKVLSETQQISVRAEGPEEFRRFFDREMEVWGAVVRENNIKLSSS